jgi:hypothetical protein
MVERRHTSIHCISAGFVVTVVIGVLLISVSSKSFAQDELFLPNTLTQGDNRQHINVSNLNNIRLSMRAEDLRSQVLNANQRALNYQWLKNHKNKEFIVGSKAYKMLFKRGFKKYWKRKRNEMFKSGLVPDLDGHGAMSNEMDYDLHVNSHELTLELTYQF